MPGEKNPRRAFIKKISVAGIATLGRNGFLPAIAANNGFGDIIGKDSVILFQGDSITDGNRSRDHDWNHVMGHGYAYLVASRLCYDQPGKQFHFLNRGVSGNKITDLAERRQADILEIKPDILSLLIGVNDVTSLFNREIKVDPVQFEETYRTILIETKKHLPDIQLVLCEPFGLPVGPLKNNWKAWYAEMVKYQTATKKLADEFDAIHVLLQQEFNNACKKAPAEYWIWDGIHPMPAGHELIARKWINTVKKKLTEIA